MVKIKEQLDTLLHKEMDRKNFLQYSGGIFLAAVGVTGLVRILLNGDKDLLETVARTDTTPKATHGYGGSRYGQ